MGLHRIVLAGCLAWGAAAESEMVLIAEGSFKMGRTRLTADEATGMRPRIVLDDRPVRVVQLDAYWIDAREVTNKRYAHFVKDAGHRAPYHWRGGQLDPAEEELPVVNVSWSDAAGYCQWARKRLPTEAEWERAARGGRENLNYPWGDSLETGQARFNSQAGPGRVGKFPPNEFGLYDVVGNVSEWCADWFDREYYAAGESRNPKGPATGEYRVLRGGAWSDSAARSTVFFRNWVRPNQRTPNIGFRCAKTSEGGLP